MDAHRSGTRLSRGFAMAVLLLGIGLAWRSAFVRHAIRHVVVPGGGRQMARFSNEMRDDAQLEQQSGSRQIDTERIARRAYERYQARGGEHGHDQEDWFAAEQEVRGRAGESDEIAGDVDARRLEESASGIGTGARNSRGEGRRR